MITRKKVLDIFGAIIRTKDDWDKSQWEVFTDIYKTFQSLLPKSEDEKDPLYDSLHEKLKSVLDSHKEPT